MMCWANRHTFTWSSSTAVDAMPLSLRCECGAIRREDVDPIQHLQTEVERLRAALETIRDRYGKVCAEYELCQHVACDSSVGAWMEADHALATRDESA